MGRSYANLFVGFIEELIFEQYSGPKPEFFGRYIDDCFGATFCSKPDLESFISYVNSFHPSLDFTWEISEISVTFLDITNPPILTRIYCIHPHIPSIPSILSPFHSFYV